MVSFRAKEVGGTADRRVIGGGMRQEAAEPVRKENRNTDEGVRDSQANELFP